MRKFHLLVLFLVFAARLPAQDVSKIDLFGGYSFANERFSSVGRSNLNGWNASGAVGFGDWFGLVTDFGGVYGGSATRTVSLSVTCPIGSPFPCPPVTERTMIDGRTHSFLFGPQVTVHKGKISPFVHFLLGGQRFDGTETFTIFNPPPGIVFPPGKFSRSTSGFAFAVGGGLDYRFKSNWSWRVQADYLQASFGNLPQNNVRISAGPVFHLK